jgi:hypothetical protein
MVEIFSSILVLAGILVCSSRVLQNRSYYNSVGEVFLNILFLFEDRTEYAPTYSETRFKSIGKGMSKAEVHASLGEPLSKEIYTNGVYREYWRYTRGPPNSSYWACVITFDQRGAVQDIERKCFVD